MEIFIGIVIFAAVVYLVIRLRNKGKPPTSKGPAPIDNHPSNTNVES